jgi:hypothetical protein
MATPLIYLICNGAMFDSVVEKIDLAWQIYSQSILDVEQWKALSWGCVCHLPNLTNQYT